MIDIKFEIGGRKASPNSIGDALEQAFLKEMADGIKKSLSSVRCPEHGRHPKVTVKGGAIDNLSFEVDGCCQSLIDTALKKLM